VTKNGAACWGVAPSLRPKKAGDRVTTDRRERGRATWDPAPLPGLAEVVCPPPAQPRVCQAYGRAVTAHPDRLQRREQARQAPGHTWRWGPVGAALQARRGVQCTGAVTTGAARGDRPRFPTLRAHMQGLGLLPSAASPGERRRPGASTTAGTPPDRRALGEGAWASHYPAQVRRHLHLRRDTPPQARQDTSGTAHVRLGKRDRRLLARGTQAPQGVVARARELVGGLWDIPRQGPVAP
jgi:hypothetical protein